MRRITDSHRKAHRWVDPTTQWAACTASTLLLAALTGCMSSIGIDEPDGTDPTELAVELVEVAIGLASPVLVTSPEADPRLFIVEQPGRIRVVRNGSLLQDPYLDLTGSVSTGGERGLLGLAFDPDFRANGRFFVSYTGTDGRSRVEAYREVDRSDRADPQSGAVFLEVEQPFSNHNGGHLAFGPDGKLYIGLGDGGSGADPMGNGQNPHTLLGTILRIDVSGMVGPPYEVPSDNPYADGIGGRPEVWHSGLRNPWRFSFDGDDGRLWIADVGQNRWEEINSVPVDVGGLNFGWSLMEGVECFNSMPCTGDGTTLPVTVYGRDQGCSVTGGYVYRGAAIPSLHGRYVYGDYCEGWIRTLRLSESGTATDPVELLVPRPGRITSFGVDAQQELYVVTQEGTVYRIEPAG